MSEMGRPALRVRAETTDGTTLDIISCHLKSKLLTFPGGCFSPRDEDERARFAVYALNRRAAEAAAIRTYATDLLAGDGQQRAVIVAGDLNDEPEAATTQLHGPPGSEIGTTVHIGRQPWLRSREMPVDGGAVNQDARASGVATAQLSSRSLT